jgi:hypothetical protein
MANALDVELHALGEETVAGSGSAVDIGETRSAIRVAINVTDAGGAWTATVQTSRDGSTHWRALATFKGSGAVQEDRCLDGCERYVRVSWTLTTSLTFDVQAEAHTLLAQVRDLLSEAPKAAIGNVDRSVMIDALIKGSTDAEDAIAVSNPLPLTKWPASVRQRVAAIAVYLCIRHRGYRPESPDELFLKAHDDAQKWLLRVSKGEIRPPGLSPPDNLGVHSSSGDPLAPDTYPDKFTNNWGDF